MGPHKTKKLLHNKRNGLKPKRPPTEWEKIFASYTSDKGLITRILSSPKINEPIKKWASELNRTFSKEEIQMAKKHMKKCSPPLAIQEMQIKTTLRFHLTPVSIAIVRNTTTNRCWQGCGGKRNPHTLLVGMQACIITLEKNLEAS
jgi:hypothetical protein